MQLELFDWRKEDTDEFHRALTPGQKKPWMVDMNVDNRVNAQIVSFEATAPDGSNRYVWLEIDKGVLKIHCYDHEHEEPAVTVFLDKEEVYVRGGMYEHTYRVQRDSATIAFAKAMTGFVPENPNP